MNKKNIIITIVLCIIFFALGTFLGLIIYDKINTKNPIVEDKSDNKTEEEKSLTKEELLDVLVGDWGNCEGQSCHGVIIAKKDNKVYTYMPYIMWSDGFVAGIITDVTNVKKDIYDVTVYTAAYEGLESSSPEQITTIRVNISEISAGTIYLNDTNFQKIAGDREAFYNSIMK